MLRVKGLGLWALDSIILGVLGVAFWVSGVWELRVWGFGFKVKVQGLGLDELGGLGFTCEGLVFRAY